MRTLFSACALFACAAAISAQNQGLTIKNGVDTHVEVAHSATLVPASGITVEAWITYDETTLGAGWRWPTVLRHNLSAGNEQVLLRVDAANTKNRNLRFYIRGTSLSANVFWRFTAGALKTWTHVAGTYDGQTARLYVNGKQVASSSGRGAIRSLSGKMNIGNGSLVAPGIEAWAGQIDEVRLWPFARTAAEIQQTMNMELQRVPGEVSTWNFNGKLTDSSGKNHGKAYGKLAFAKNTLKLTPVPFPGALQIGTASKKCGPAAGTAIGGIAKPGTTFGFIGLRGKARGPAFLLLSGKAASKPLPILGINLWVDLGALALIVPSTGDTLGTHRVSLPIPSSKTIVGASLAGQFLFLDPSCSSGVFSASNAISFSVLP